MCPKTDGYRLIQASQLLAGIAAFEAGEITIRALRIYLASFELLAIREAAGRSRSRGRERRQRFRRCELAAHVGLLPEASISRELTLLKGAGLLTFSESAIVVARDPAFGRELHALLGGRGAKRLVPVPRRMLRFLAACSKPALVRTIIAYLVRGMSLEASGEVRGKGTAKISWICAVSGISERAARAARAELIRLGWITKDTGSVQRKLNRDGAYFVIDTAWRHATKAFAPLLSRSRTRFAPLPKRPETPSELKDQKLAVTANAGFWRRETKPDLKNVQRDDIRRPSRLRELFEQATRARLLEPTEAGWLKFVAAAVRANRVTGDAVRVFMGIVRKGLWHHISTADEERARAVLLASQARRDGLYKAEPLGVSREGQDGTQRGERAPSELQGLIQKIALQIAMPKVASECLWE